MGNNAGVRRKSGRRLFVFCLVVTACRSLPSSSTQLKYVVTSAPLSLSVPSRPLCVAIDPSDAHGAWWWEPGETGCATKSTGPGVFHAESATISSYLGSQALQVGFRVPLHGPPAFVDVALTVENGSMRSRDGSSRVPVAYRADLDLPMAPPRK